MKWNNGFRTAVVLAVIFGIIFGLSEVINSNAPPEVQKMRINDVVLTVPRDALWLPPLLVGSDFWSKEGYKVPDANKLQDFASMSLRGCWIPGVGFSYKQSIMMCKEENNKYEVSIGLYATRSGHAEGMIKRGLDAELKKSSVRTWGGVGEYNYGEWPSGYDGLKLMRLLDLYGVPVPGNELWNILLFIPDSDLDGNYYVSCPYFAVMPGAKRGGCDNRSIWSGTDIYVTINYSGRVVGRSKEIMNDVFGFLDSMLAK